MAALEYLKLMAEYNQWMNDNIYRAAHHLDEHELSNDKGAYFKSIIGTLNHIMVGDIIWFQRVANGFRNNKSLDFIRSLSKPNTLDEIIFDSIEELTNQRKKIDMSIIAFVDELNGSDLEKPLAFQNMKGIPLVKNTGLLMLHIFNHQTHHRGQISTLFSQLGIDIGVTDLLYKIPDINETDI